jgi:Phosphotransferase enzyme family
VLVPWDQRPLADLLAAHGLTGLEEAPFPNDGWSGATLTQLRRGDERYVLKRTSWAQDWIARATADHALREGFVATGQLPLPAPFASPYLGAAIDGARLAILMPDLGDRLLAWERRDGAPTVSRATLDGVLEALARLHGARTDDLPVTTGDTDVPWPWCPVRERLLLLTRPSAERLAANGVAAGTRFLEGWAAFDRLAIASAQELVHGLAADPSPLLAALATLPATLLHGDLKLANLALFDGGRIAAIDWQMVMRAPVAIELGWLLVSNSAALPLPPAEVLERYLAASAAAGSVSLGDPAAQRDLAWIVGLLLRGWRKGLDAEAGQRLASGVPAGDDLAWWCEQALDAADRRL